MPRTLPTSSEESILQELLRVRRELAKERARLDALEYLGLETRRSNFGVYDCILPRATRRQWITRFGSRHKTLREALDELLAHMQISNSKGSTHE